MPDEPFATLALARLLRPWGRKGEVAAEILTDFPGRLTCVRRVWLAGAAGDPREFSVSSCRLHCGQAVFRFEGVSSIDDAEKLRNLEVQVPLSERTPLAAGRYYLSDLIGCEVREEGAASRLGVVRDVQPLAQNVRTPEAWVLVLETGSGGELLVPLAAEICVMIDVAARQISLRLPQGLRELNG